MTVKAAGYYRVSTPKQAEPGSLTPAAYRKGVVKLAADRGWDLPGDRMFYDPGKSGTNLERPEFQALVQVLPEVQWLIFPNHARLSRDERDSAELADILVEHGVTPITVDGHEMKVDTASGRLEWGVFSLFAAYNRREFLENMKRARDQARLLGYWPKGHPPYGYTTGPDPENPKRRILVPDRPKTPNGHKTPEYPILRRAGEWFLNWQGDGTGETELVKRLNEENVRNRHGGRWSQGTIGKWFLPEMTHYLGWLPGAEESRHGRIWEDDEWAKLIRHFHHTGEHRGKKAPEFLLFGILKCGRCGKTMGCRSAKRKDGSYSQFYRCHGKSRLKNGCTQMPILRALIDDPVERMIRARLLDVTEVDATAAVATKRERVATETAIKKAEAEVKNLDQTRKSTDEEYAQSGGSVSLAQYTSAIAMLDAKRLAVMERLASLNARLAEFSEPKSVEAYKGLAATIFDPQRRPGTVQAINKALRPFVRFKLVRVPVGQEDEAYILPLAPGRAVDAPAAELRHREELYKIIPIDYEGEVVDPELVWDPDYEDEEGKGAFREVGEPYAATAAIPVTVPFPRSGEADRPEKGVSVITS